MKQPIIVAVLGLATIVPASCSKSSSDCADRFNCMPIGEGVDDAGQDARPAPRDCNLENICPDEGAGIFVAPAPNGSDSVNDGTKARPFRTFARALRSRAGDAGVDAGGADGGRLDGGTDAGPSELRIYACEGQYAENVQLDDHVTVYGGFSCADWKYIGTQPVVIGEQPLRIRSAHNVSLSDIAFEALPASKPGTSSIAGLVSNSTVKLVRTAFSSGPGKDGADQVDALPFTPAVAPSATSYPGADNPLCLSRGGGGGFCDRQGGSPGDPQNIPAIPEGSTGAGGPVDANCGPASNGTRGADGTTGGQGGPSAIRLGILTAEQWTPAGGGAASVGAIGQGGGGSTGPVVDGSGGPCHGAGGGAGGCGGAPGAGAAGGGASIALALFKSQVTIQASRFHTESGGKGGKGGAGGQGQAGGGGSSAGVPACPDGSRVGARGGAGGGGGGGGGGAGGMSVAILWSGAAPTINGQSVLTASSFDGVSLGSAGAGGLPGAGGKAGNGGDPRADGKTPAAGIAGVAQAVLGLTENGSVITGDRP